MAPRIPGTYEPNIPGASSGARHDARAFPRRYSPALLGDEVGLHDVRRGVGGGVVPMDEAVARATADIPPQLVQGSFLIQIKQFGTAGAQLLIPKNPNRLSFLVANFWQANLLMFSFDQPIGAAIGAGSAGIGAGIPIGCQYQEQNGLVSINDIWVFCNDPAENYPFPVLGYQGQLSITGNRRAP